MAAFVQSASQIANGNNVLAFSGNNTAGNFLIAAVSCVTTGQSFSVTDSAGNSYLSLAAVTDITNTAQSQIFFVPSCLAGANTVTFAPGIVANGVLAIHEFSGVTGLALKGSAFGSGTSATSPTTKVNPGLSFGFISGNSSGTISSITEGTGWTLGEKNVTAPTFLTEWQISGGLLAATASISLGKGGAYPWTAELAGLSQGASTPFVSFGLLQWTGW